MTTTDEYVPSDEEVQELIVGLLLDAGDYVRDGQPDPGETLTWDQREVRAWRAARLLSERHAYDARIRRDAAREALDGLMVHAETRCGLSESHRARDDWNTVAGATQDYRDTHYPMLKRF